MPTPEEIASALDPIRAAARPPLIQSDWADQALAAIRGQQAPAPAPSGGDWADQALAAVRQKKPAAQSGVTFNLNVAAGPLDVAEALRKAQEPTPQYYDPTFGPRSVVAALNQPPARPKPAGKPPSMQDYQAVYGAGTIDPAVLAERKPKGLLERIGRGIAPFAPGVGPVLQHRQETGDAYAELAMRKLVPRAPQIQSDQQRQRLAYLDNLLSDYSQQHGEVGLGAQGMVSGVGAEIAGAASGLPALIDPRLKGAQVAPGQTSPERQAAAQEKLKQQYGKAAQAYDWPQFNAYLQKNGIKDLSPWDKQVLVSALSARKLGVANQAASDQHAGQDVFNYVLGAAVGSGVAKAAMPYLAAVKGPIGAMARASITAAESAPASLGARALQALNPISEGAIAGITGQEVMAQPKTPQEALTAALAGYGFHAAHGLIAAPFGQPAIASADHVNDSVKVMPQVPEAAPPVPEQGFDLSEPTPPEIRPGDVVRLDEKTGRRHDVHTVEGGQAIITGRRNPVDVSRLSVVERRGITGPPEPEEMAAAPETAAASQATPEAPQPAPDTGVSGLPAGYERPLPPKAGKLPRESGWHSSLKSADDLESQRFWRLGVEAAERGDDQSGTSRQSFKIGYRAAQEAIARASEAPPAPPQRPEPSIAEAIARRRETGADVLSPAEEAAYEREARGLQGPQEMAAGLNLGRLMPRIRDANGDLRNFSDTKALRSGTTRNLSQLEHAEPDTYLAARQAAAAPQIADNILNQTAYRIDQAYGHSGAHIPFYETLGDSNLMGKIDQYREMGAKAFSPRTLPDTAFDAKTLPDTLSHLKLVEGGQATPLPGSQAVETAAQAGNIPAARQALAATYNHAADLIEHQLGPQRIQAVEAAIKDPHFQRAKQLYQQTLETPIRSFHTAVGGQLIDDQHLGPAGAYFPLTAVDENGEVLRPKGGTSLRMPFKRPGNPRGNFRTGLSEHYAFDPETLRSQVVRAVQANTRAHMWDTAEANGLIQRVPAGKSVPAGGYSFKRQTYTPALEEGSALKAFIRRGADPFFVAGERIRMPRWFRDEVGRIVDEGPGNLRQNALGEGLGGVTKLATTDPLLGLIHGRNLMSVLVTNTPGLEGISGKLPVLKAFAAAWQVGRGITPEEYIAITHHLARLGLLHPATGSLTVNSAYALSTGAALAKPGNLFLGGKAILYGPGGLDVRTRILLYKILRAENPSATDAQIIERVGQAGNYVKPLQGWLQSRVLTQLGAPFFEAGKQMTANAIRGTVPFAQPVQATGGRMVALKTLQTLSGGLVGITGAWIAAHKAKTGKYPWELKTPYGMIPISGPGKGGKIQYADFVGAFAPGVKRGLRDIGASGIYNTLTEGGKGTAGLALEQSGKDILNAGLHPFAGPPVSFGTIAATGSEPYIASLRDRNTARFGPQLRGVTPPTRPGVGQIRGNLKAALIGTMPTVQNLLGEDRPEDQRDPGHRMLQALLGWTGVEGPLMNPTAKGIQLRTEERKADRAAGKYERRHPAPPNPFGAMLRRR